MFSWSCVNNATPNGFLKPDPTFTEVRRQHWLNSRQALIYSCQNLGIERVEQKSLEITDHHHLTDFPDALVSLTHTRGAGAAVTALRGSGIRGVGIDIEKKSRLLKKGVLSKISDNPEEESPTGIHLWTAKEAAFKALSPFWQQSKTFILKDIKVMGDAFSVEELGSGSLHWFEWGDYLLCIARF